MDEYLDDHTEDHMSRLTVSEPAPDFTLPSNEGGEVSLSDYRGRHLVIFFYPAAMTPGCTKEACDFRDNLAGLAEPVVGSLARALAGARRVHVFGMGGSSAAASSPSSRAPVCAGDSPGSGLPPGSMKRSVPRLRTVRTRPASSCTTTPVTTMGGWSADVAVMVARVAAAPQ